MSDYGSEVKDIVNNFFSFFFEIYFLFENLIHKYYIYIIPIPPPHPS